MDKRYSQFTKEELLEECKRLQTLGQQAFDNAYWNEYEVHMKKWYLAQSYLIKDTNKIQIGQTYPIAEEQDALTVHYFEGVMAWGTRRSNGEETAIPIAMLEEES